VFAAILRYVTQSSALKFEYGLRTVPPEYETVVMPRKDAIEMFCPIRETASAGIATVAAVRFAPALSTNVASFESCVIVVVPPSVGVAF